MIHILQLAPLPCQVLQHQVAIGHSYGHKDVFELFYSSCVTHRLKNVEPLVRCTYLARNLRNCKHLAMIISLRFLLVSAAAETCLPVETSPAGFS